MSLFKLFTRKPRYVARRLNRQFEEVYDAHMKTWVLLKLTKLPKVEYMQLPEREPALTGSEL